MRGIIWHWPVSSCSAGMKHSTPRTTRSGSPRTMKRLMRASRNYSAVDEVDGYGLQPNATRFLKRIGCGERFHRVNSLCAVLAGCDGLAPGELTGVTPYVARSSGTPAPVRQLAGSDQAKHFEYAGLVFFLRARDLQAWQR